MLEVMKGYADDGEYGCYSTTLPDGKATDFKIDGSFYYDDYANNLSDSIGRRKDIYMVPDVIFVSEAGMERLTKEPIISAIGVNIKDFDNLERIDSELQAINSTLTESEWQLTSSVNQKELFEQMNYSLSLLGNGAAILLIVIGLIAAIFVICLNVPSIVYKATSDETVIERLHNFDN